MQTKKGKAFLVVIVLVFIFFGAYILTRAQGWIIDFKNFKVVKTGGIFLKFYPSDSRITINGSIKKTSSGIINTGTVIKNLIPAEYFITISKDGFRDWQKRIKVSPGIVTAASQIKLIRKKSIEETITDTAIKDFWLTKKGVVYKSLDEKLHLEKDILKGRNVTRNNSSSNLLITEEGGIYFLIDLAKPYSALNINEMFNGLKNRKLNLPGIVSLKFVSPHPFSEEKLILASNNALYLLDIKKIDVEVITELKNPEFFTLGNNDITVFQKNNEIKSVNLILKSASSYLIPKISEVKDVKISKNSDQIIFLEGNLNKLVYFDKGEGEIIKIAEGVKEFKISNNGKKIGFINTLDELFVYYLEDEEGDIKREKGDFLEIKLRENKNLSNFSWLEGTNYFLILANQKLLIGENDNREPINIYPLNDKIFKYVFDKGIYFIGEDKKLTSLTVF